ncbi:MAG: mycofactocin precursor MftA [Actinomycetota bacterium]|nr:mycofactocin precursor MftA [Actinomycetota bacterium]
MEPTATTPSDQTGDEHADDAGVEEEMLVEEISIDGMCGVY